MSELSFKVVGPDSPDFAEVMSGLLPIRRCNLDYPQGLREYTKPAPEDLNPRNVNVVAYCDETLVGGVRIEPKDETEVDIDSGHEVSVAEIRKMVINEPFQGRGIGRALLERAEHEAMSRGIGSFVLSSTNGKESTYKRWGYAATGWKMYNYIYYQVMKKSLTNV